MAKILYESILKSFEKFGLEEGKRELKEQIKAKTIDPFNFDFSRFWEAAYGWNEFNACRADNKHSAVQVMEAAGAVTTASFQAISGQIIYSMTMDAYQSPDFVFTRAIPTRPSIYSFEKVAGVSEVGDEATTVGEGDDYPTVGVTEDYINLAETRKRGFKVLLTREVIFFDRTGLIQSRCAGAGKSMGQNREKRAVDCIIDENAGAVSAALGGHRYHWRGTSIATYGNNSGTHNWDNLQASNALVDWTDVDNAEQLLNQMTDPNTGEPIVFMAKHLVVGKSLQRTAERIRNATEITVVSPGYATSGAPNETKVTNPFANQFEVLTSPYVEARLATDTSWFYGDIGMAFVYVENWAPEVRSLAGGTQLEFDRDIVQQYRFSEYGAYSTKEPRAMVTNTA